MASDPFTNTNGTQIGAHTAAGVTWAAMGLAEPAGEINGNVVNAGSGFNVAARASNSTSSYSQIVFKAGTYAGESKGVSVRGGLATRGYSVMCYDAPTGDTFTTLALRKDEGFLAGITVSMNRLVDNTLAILATTVGSDVQIQAWLNGNPITFNESLPGFEGPPSTTFTDTAANSPLLSGNPGFYCYFFDGMTAANSAFDDWTDVQGGGGGSVVVTSVTPSTMRVAQVGVALVGTGFGAAQGSGSVKISPTDDVADVNAVSQTVTSWGDTASAFNVVLGALSLTGPLYLFVTSDGAVSNAAGFVVEIDPAAAVLAFGAGLLD